MRPLLQQVFGRQVGVKALNPVVKFLCAVVMFCNLANLAGWYYIVSSVTSLAVNPVNAVVGVGPETSDVVFYHHRLGTAVKTVGLREHLELVSCEPELSVRRCSVVHVSDVNSSEIGFSTLFSSRSAPVCSNFGLETPTAFRFPVRDYLFTAVAFEPKEAPPPSAFNRIVFVSFDFFDEGETPVSIAGISLYFGHSHCNYGLMSNDTVTSS